MPWMARRHIKEQARPHSDRRTQIPETSCHSDQACCPRYLSGFIPVSTQPCRGHYVWKAIESYPSAAAWNCCISCGKLQIIHLLCDTWNRNACDMGETLSAFCHIRGRMELLAQWDSQANLPLTPETIPYGNTKKVWWQSIHQNPPQVEKCPMIKVRMCIM